MLLFVVCCLVIVVFVHIVCRLLLCAVGVCCLVFVVRGLLVFVVCS